MLEGDGHESCDDDTESRCSGGQVDCSVDDVVDIASFSKYVAAKTDGKQAYVYGYLRLLRSRGADQVIGGRSLKSLRRDYRKYVYGRLCAYGPSLQTLCRKARQTALEHIPGGVYELDSENSFSTFRNCCAASF